MQLFRRTIRVLLFALAYCLSVVSQTWAVGVVVAPAFQFVTVHNDQAQVEVVIELTNQTDQSQVFTLSAVDIRQFDESGRIGLVDKPMAENHYSLAPYLELSETQTDLAANETRQIVVRVKNSPDLSPGGHYGAVVAEVVSAGAEGEQVVVPAVSAIILVHKVGGEQFHLNLKSVDLPDVWFQIPRSVRLQFENYGNVHVIPRGQVVLFDVFNRRVAEGTINEGSLVLLPETQRSLTTTLASRNWAIPFVPLTLQVRGYTEVGAIQFSQSVIVGYLPALLLIGTFLVLVIGGLFIRHHARIKR